MYFARLKPFHILSANIPKVKASYMAKPKVDRRGDPLCPQWGRKRVKNCA